MKIENGLKEFLKKHGLDGWESIEVVSDDGKTVCIKLDFGDDEVIRVTINRRKGDNGNYRIVVMA